MDENVGKSPDRVENAEWQNRLKLDAEGVSDDFALASDGQAMTSSSADTAKDEPGQAAGPARNEILPHSLRLPMIAAALAATAALGSFAGSLTGSGVTQFWPRFAPTRLEKQRKSAASEITGTVPNTSAPVKAKILPNWILHGVRGRHALVENSDGDLFEITDDSTLPGVGRVEGVKRQVGQWVVVTARGLITSAP